MGSFMHASTGGSNGAKLGKMDNTIAKRAHYAPPWADVSIIGIAGSSGSGKSTLAQAIVKKLNLPWVVILSMVSPVWLGQIGSMLSFDVLGFLLQEPGRRGF
jgi:hypothetical protein